MGSRETVHQDTGDFIGSMNLRPGTKNLFMFGLTEDIPGLVGQLTHENVTVIISPGIHNYGELPGTLVRTGDRTVAYLTHMEDENGTEIVHQTKVERATFYAPFDTVAAITRTYVDGISPSPTVGMVCIKEHGTLL